MTHNLSVSLVEAGHRVVVLSPFSGDERVKAAPYTYIQDREARPEIMSGPAWHLEEGPRAMKMLEGIVEDHQITRALSLHPHYYGQALMELKAHFSKNGRSFPSTGSVYHGLELFACLRWPNLKQALHERVIQRRASHRVAVFETVKKSDIVFCNSQFTQSLVKRIKPRGYSHVIGCGISQNSIDEYSDISAPARVERRVKARDILNLPKNVQIVGTVGRLVPHKNIEALINLISTSPDGVHGLIAGNGHHHRELMQLAVHLGVEERVHFRPIPDEFSKWKAIEAMDQFVLLSKTTRAGGVEGFGIVMLEAMAAGIPVISSGTGGMRDVLLDGETGFFAPLKKRQRLKTISRLLLSNEELVDKTVKLAQIRVREKFLWAQVCHRMLKAWDNV